MQPAEKIAKARAGSETVNIANTKSRNATRVGQQHRQLPRERGNGNSSINQRTEHESSYDGWAQMQYVRNPPRLLRLCT